MNTEHERATHEARIQHGAWLNHPFTVSDHYEAPGSIQVGIGTSKSPDSIRRWPWVLLGIVIGALLTVLLSARLASAGTIHVLDGWVGGADRVGMVLSGDRGFTVAAEGVLGDSISGFIACGESILPPRLGRCSPGQWISMSTVCCSMLPWLHGATLDGQSYRVGPIWGPPEAQGDSEVVAWVSGPFMLTPEFPWDVDCPRCRTISSTAPFQLTGSFTHLEEGQPVTERLIGEGIVRLTLRLRDWGPEGPGPFWEFGEQRYLLGLDPTLADAVWRHDNGDPLQTAPEPATLMLLGASAVVVGWRLRRVNR